VLTIARGRTPDSRPIGDLERPSIAAELKRKAMGPAELLHAHSLRMKDLEMKGKSERLCEHARGRRQYGCVFYAVSLGKTDRAGCMP
jgi:hypothetical protein